MASAAPDPKAKSTLNKIPIDIIKKIIDNLDCKSVMNFVDTIKDGLDTTTKKDIYNDILARCMCGICQEIKEDDTENFCTFCNNNLCESCQDDIVDLSTSSFKYCKNCNLCELCDGVRNEDYITIYGNTCLDCVIELEDDR